MTAPAAKPYVAEFADPAGVLAGTDRLQREGFRILDALVPFPMPDLARRVGADAGALRPAMAAAGFGTAALFFAMEAYSQGWAYPLNSGGRPLVSWQVYPLVPFETGVLAAAVAGLAVLLWKTGLPRLHHPLFAVPGIERATQDRFFLVVEGPASPFEARRLQKTLFEAGALSVGEMGP